MTLKRFRGYSYTMRFAIATLGCKVNQYDSETIREALVNDGNEELGFTDNCDLYIINTCTVTHRSDSDSRKLIRRALKTSDSARVIATGCKAVTDPGSLRDISPRVEVATPSKLASLLGLSFSGSITRFHHRSRAFVKIQQGCDNFCTYCIVPYARGKPRSRDIDEILQEIRQLNSNAYREIVLTGVNIGLHKLGLSYITKKILEQTRVERIRISSIEPWTFQESLLELVADEPRLCKHLHLPMQSASDRILESMARPYTARYFSDLVHGIHIASPDIAIGTDIIVGFPGEDDRAFQETLNMVESLPLAYLHVFPYSRRPGTKAYVFTPQVDELTKKKRVSILRKISQKKRRDFALGLMGRDMDVLVTGSESGMSTGITTNYQKVMLKGPVKKPGSIVNARITGLKSGRLQATI